VMNMDHFRCQTPSLSTKNLRWGTKAPSRGGWPEGCLGCWGLQDR